MRKIERKLRKRRNRRDDRLTSDSGDSMSRQASPVPSLLEVGPDLDPVVLNEEEGSSDPYKEPEPGPSTQIQPDSEECILDNEILDLLGESPSDTKKTGDNIQKDIALRWEHIATSGLAKEVRKNLLDKHLVPGNCQRLASPILNVEIKAALSDTMKGKDKATQNKQSQVASAIACIGEALTKIFNSQIKDVSIIKPLIEGAQLLCDLQYNESMKRRSLICASIKKEIKTQLYETKIDTYLFGENLSETLKAAKAINKSGSEIRIVKSKVVTPRTQTRALNSKPQLVNGRQPARRRQEPAYAQTAIDQLPPTALQRRQYQAVYPMSALPPPPPPPPPPSPPPPVQQRHKQRPYQRR